MSRKRFPFEKLEVWQEARKLVKEVHVHTRAYPKAEMYGLTAQVNRAALSVANNLAEGSSRMSLKDQAHFSNQAYGSLMETASDIIVASDLGYVDEEATDPILNHAYDLSVRIHNLRQSQLTRAKP
ncbi:MAG: four helix bundle protein [Verrucomicrobiaceae bacterium]|nr:four helix bundle protein [Verrucomicrobiaceae bacterium]